MNKSVVIFSITVAAIILTFLLFSILAILFKYWGDTTSVKDSLSIISGIFGGITTLGAAIVAAYLFNDWKVQHNKTIENNFINDVIDKFNAADNQATEIVVYFNNIKGFFLINLMCDEVTVAEFDLEIKGLYSRLDSLRILINSIRNSSERYSKFMNCLYSDEEEQMFLNINTLLYSLSQINDVNERYRVISYNLHNTIPNFILDYEKKYLDPLITKLKA